MSTHRMCAKCGKTVDPSVLGGFCLQCLLDPAADEELPTATDPTDAQVRPGSTSAYLWPEPLARVGDYDLLEEIARGGMGVVYKARQRSLQRTVAVKMVLSGRFASRNVAERFKAEAIAAALLRHPNIVGIHEVGMHDDQPFFSMDFVEGKDLAQFVGNRPLPPKNAARYVKQIAEAIHYAHEHGILHRDLKPSNVLIDSATDEPRVSDFGLAKRLDGDSSLTLTGQILGSPNFMPPEQASPGHGKVGRHSDVYGLGAILYFLLTARAPFQAESLPALVNEVVSTEPVPPRLLNPSVPRDLETICLKCLEKEPHHRYYTAQQVADELSRFLKDEPILARPVLRVERIWRWCRRKPALAALGAVAMALLLTVALGTPVAMARIQRARVQSERNLYAADMRLASEAVKNGTYNLVRELLERHRPAPGQEDLRGFEWRYFKKVLEDHQPERTFAGLPEIHGWANVYLFVRKNILYEQSGDDLRAWDMSTWAPLPLRKPSLPDWGRWVWDPAADAAYAIDNTNATVTVYRLPECSQEGSFHMPGAISAAATSLNRELLAVAVGNHGKHRVIVTNLARKEQTVELGEFDAEIRELVFAPDDAVLGGLDANGILGLWDVRTMQPLPTPTMTGKVPKISRFFFVPGARRLMFCELIRSGRFIEAVVSGWSTWDFGTKEESALEIGGVWQWHPFPSPDGRYIVTSPNRQELNLFDARNLQLLGTMHGHLGLVVGVGWSPDGKLLATASVDQTARVWDLATRQQIATLGGFGEKLADVEFSADGRQIVVVSGPGTMKVYDASKVLNSGLFAIAPEGMRDVTLSPDQRLLATRAFGGTVTVWDRTSRKEVHRIVLADTMPGNTAFAPDGKTLAWASGTALRMLSLESAELKTIPLEGNRNDCNLAWSPEGRELAFGCGAQLLVLDLKSQSLRKFAVADDEVFVPNFSPDGKLLAFGDRRGTLTVCDRNTGQIWYKTNAHPPHLYWIQFSPDGRMAATSGADSSVKLWEVHPHGFALRKDLRGHLGYIDGVSFSPDGTRLVSCSGDQTIKIWDVADGIELATLYGHVDYVGAAKFTKDGNTIYSTGFGYDHQIRFWSALPADQLGTATRTLPSP